MLIKFKSEQYSIIDESYIIIKCKYLKPYLTHSSYNCRTECGIRSHYNRIKKGVYCQTEYNGYIFIDWIGQLLLKEFINNIEEK